MKEGKKKQAIQRENEIRYPPQMPLFDDCPVQRDTLEKVKKENKSEGSHKICRGQKP